MSEVIPVIPLLALISAVGGALAAFLYRLGNRITAIETKFNIFWSVIEQQLPKVLIRPTHEEVDELLRRMMDGSMSETERMRLVTALKNELDKGLHTTDPHKALAYVFLLARLESGLVRKKPANFEDTKEVKKKWQKY